MEKYPAAFEYTYLLSAAPRPRDALRKVMAWHSNFPHSSRVTQEMIAGSTEIYNAIYALLTEMESWQK